MNRWTEAHPGIALRGSVPSTAWYSTTSSSIPPSPPQSLWPDGATMTAAFGEPRRGQELRRVDQPAWPIDSLLAQAPSDPRTLFAGTLEGVFRSTDAGASWTLISPQGSKEIHEIESLAVDPTNPDILYAAPGTCRGRRRTAASTGTTSRRGSSTTPTFFPSSSIR